MNTTPGLIGSVCDFANGANGRIVAAQPNANGGLVVAAMTATDRFVARVDGLGGFQSTVLLGNYAGDGGQLLDVTPMTDGRTALLETHDSTGAAYVTIVDETRRVRRATGPCPPFDASHGVLRPPGPAGAGRQPGADRRPRAGLRTRHRRRCARTPRVARPQLLHGRLQRRPVEPSAAARPRRDRLGRSHRPGSGRRHQRGRPPTHEYRRDRRDVRDRRQLRGPAAGRPTASATWSSAPTAGPTCPSTATRPAPPSKWPWSPRPGALDTTFSGDGDASYDAGADHLRGATSAALAPTGDLYVFADDPTGTDDPVVVRFDGTPLPPVPSMTRPHLAVDPLELGAPRVDGDRRHDGAQHRRAHRRAPYGALAPAESTPLVTETTARSRTRDGRGRRQPRCAPARAPATSGRRSRSGAPSAARRCRSRRPSSRRGRASRPSPRPAPTPARSCPPPKKGATISRSGVKAKRIALVVTTCSTCGKVRSPRDRPAQDGVVEVGRHPEEGRAQHRRLQLDALGHRQGQGRDQGREGARRGRRRLQGVRAPCRGSMFVAIVSQARQRG